MMKKLLLIIVCIISFEGISQEIKVDITFPLTGQIVDFNGKTPLKAAHLFNLNSVIGTVTNDEGNFEIPTAVNDTLYISYLGYQSIKLKITNDLLKGNELVIELHEKTEKMKEIVVKSHKLIGVLKRCLLLLKTTFYQCIIMRNLRHTS